MSKLKVPTSFNIDLEFDTPEFHKRLFAWAIDFIIFFIYYLIVVKFLLSNNSSGRLHDEDINWLFIALMLPIALYPLVTEFIMNGQTFGKKILKLKVINESGGNATFSQFLIRWMLRVSDLILFVMLILLIIYGSSFLKSTLFFFLLAVTDVFCIALTKKSQRLGDMAASTLIIQIKNKSNLDDTVFMEIENNYVPQYPEVMKLSDRDMNVIRNIYNTAYKKSDYALAGRTADKIRGVLHIQYNDTEPIEFLEVLLKDYNYLSTK
jgi:uncharacterized RDD family membrane protein YckC